MSRTFSLRIILRSLLTWHRSIRRCFLMSRVRTPGSARRDRTGGRPWLPFNAALLILIFPAGFRFTCYYYRKAYYRSFWLDPPACAVGEPRSSYWGENHWPLLIQNIHRYFMYFAVLFLVFLWHDAILAFWWPVLDAHGSPTGHHTFGIGLGSVIMLVNVYLLTGYTLGCHSFRHLIGGRKNCFSCPVNGQLRPTTSYRFMAVEYDFERTAPTLGLAIAFQRRLHRPVHSPVRCRHLERPPHLVILNPVSLRRCQRRA
jgi:hypothetical protein